MKLTNREQVHINDEIAVSPKELFKTVAVTKDVSSDSKLLEAQDRKMKKTLERGNDCKFYEIDGVDFSLYTITNQDITVIEKMLKPQWTTYDLNHPKAYNSWKFGYISNNQIVMLYGNHVVADNRDLAISIFKGVKEYCKDKGEPFAYNY